MSFGKKLKYLREMREWTLEDVANLYNKKFNAKMSKGALSRYENDLQEPMINSVVKFAKLFNVSPNYLLDMGEDDDTQEIVDFVSTNPAAKIFFDTAKNCTASDIIKAIKILEALKEDK